MVHTKTTALEKIIQSAQEAYQEFRKTDVSERVRVMQSIANHIENLGSELIETAQAETHLPEARLKGEKARTVNQWRSYAAAIESGTVLDLRIDTPDAEGNTIAGDIRKTQAPLGIVAIFGASNFPFAFSTAGGDTASAIAAGNAVIVKGHPGHPKTAQLMGGAISAGIEEAGFHKGLFAQVFGKLQIGKELVTHKAVKAVGFTGSFTGGKALYDRAQERPEPIPVFSEMGSINPLFLLPKRLQQADHKLAEEYIGSLTLGTGQFCTNPGLLVVQETKGLEKFIADSQKAITERPAEKMLHQGISESYFKLSGKMIDHEEVEVIAKGQKGKEDTGQAILATTTAQAFLKHEAFCGEVFGPFGLIIICQNKEEMRAVAAQLDGQLTATLLAEPEELPDYEDLVDLLREKCGRLIFNNFPTGVAVCYGMQHGGPFPATTDSRFTSVGPDAIKRFMRPVAYQNWPKNRLPKELRNENELDLYRTVNGKITREKIGSR